MTFLKKRINLADVTKLQARLRGEGLHTVCEEAKCPNIGECFGKKIATFLIAGPVCTRACRFCAIEKGHTLPLDTDEPQRVAGAVKELGLRYVVVTSVTRDDLPDGAAEHFRAVVAAVRSMNPDTAVEILVPDFGGDGPSIDKAVSSKPDVFSHNLETVPRLYASARAGADYRRSLGVLARAGTTLPLTKSGLMLGLGETEDEVVSVMKDLRKTGCSILTLGQYLAPSKQHLPVLRHLKQEEFERYRTIALELGFRQCPSHPYVRSSYRADAALDLL